MLALNSYQAAAKLQPDHPDVVRGQWAMFLAVGGGAVAVGLFHAER